MVDGHTVVDHDEVYRILQVTLAAFQNGDTDVDGFIDDAWDDITAEAKKQGYDPDGWTDTGSTPDLIEKAVKYLAAVKAATSMIMKASGGAVRIQVAEFSASYGGSAWELLRKDWNDEWRMALDLFFETEDLPSDKKRYAIGVVKGRPDVADPAVLDSRTR